MSECFVDQRVSGPAPRETVVSRLIAGTIASHSFWERYARGNDMRRVHGRSRPAAQYGGVASKNLGPGRRAGEPGEAGGAGTAGAAAAFGAGRLGGTCVGVGCPAGMAGALTEVSCGVVFRSRISMRRRSWMSPGVPKTVSVSLVLISCAPESGSTFNPASSLLCRSTLTTETALLGLTLALRKERIVFDMRNGIITQLP